MRNLIVGFIIILSLWYVIMPVPRQEEFVLPPNSVSVNTATDTSGYFTDERRGFTTKYYQNEYQRLHCSFLRPINPYCYFKPLKINHSPALAPNYTASKEKSTYLEEYFYPLADALIVNGYEPYNEKNVAFDKNSAPLMLAGKQYNSEVIIRYSGSSVEARVFIYFLIWVSVYLLVRFFKLIKKG